MKKIGIFISVILVLILSVIFIAKIINSNTINDNFKTTTTEALKYYESYNIIEEKKEYKKYFITADLDKDFNINIDNIYIKYKNKSLYINNEIMVDNVIIYQYFSLYDNSRLLILYKYNDSFKSGIIFYNALDKTKEVIETIDNMYIKINENTFISDLGISVELSIVDNNKIYINNHYYNICKFGYNNNLTAIKGIEYLYDYNNKKLDKVVDIYKLPLESYVLNNKLCQKE